MARIAINGLGRIGRAALKIVLDRGKLELVAVNDLIPNHDLVYLLKYDTVYRRYERQVESVADGISIDGTTYKAFSEKDPTKLPWKDLDIDLVLECTGVLRKREDLEKHLQAGAKQVILSAPAKSEDVTTVVHGVAAPDVGSNQIISCASCTTNCITPIVEIVGRRIGVKKAMMSTIHAYTASQAIVDGPHKKPRRGRAGAANFVPTSTGAARATTKVLPEYADRFDGVAVRGPVPAGSIADLVFLTERAVTIDEVIDILKEEAASEKYRGIVGVTEDPIVSSDIIRDGHAAVVDLEMTRVVDGDLVKIMAWYDNEWGYATQMVKEAERISA
jgi:glyceraldehyde 3-phosphate dehydrogenase